MGLYSFSLICPPPGESGLSRVSGLLNFSLKAFHAIREVASSDIKDGFLGVQRIKLNFLKKEEGPLYSV